MKSAIYFLIAGVGLAAQTAQVVQLAPADTAKAKTAYDALQTAQKAWDAARAEVEHKYLSEEKESLSASTWTTGTSLVTSGAFPNSACAAPGSTLIYNGAGSLVPSEYDQDCLKRIADGETIHFKDGDCPVNVATGAAKGKAQEECRKWHDAHQLVVKAAPKQTFLARRDGWANWEFSSDFKAVVPGPYQATTGVIQGSQNPCWNLTPSYTIPQ